MEGKEVLKILGQRVRIDFQAASKRLASVEGVVKKATDSSIVLLDDREIPREKIFHITVLEGGKNQIFYDKQELVAENFFFSREDPCTL